MIGLIEILFCCVLTLLSLCPVGCLSLEKFSWHSQQGRDSNVRKQQNKISIRPILFLYYEESLISSNLNSKLFRFHCVGPNVGCSYVDILVVKSKTEARNHGENWWNFFVSWHFKRQCDAYFQCKLLVCLSFFATK